MDFRSRFLLVILLGSIVLSYAHPAAAQSANQPGGKEPALELRLRVTESKYCSSGGMLLTVEFEYKNVGKHNLILFKHALAPYQYRFSQNAQAAKSKRYEKVITPMIGGVPGRPEFGDEPSSEYFVILEPGQSHTPTNNIGIWVFIAAAAKEVSKDSLGPGEHALDMLVSTWPFETSLESQLRARWQRFGNLWSQDITSVPTTFRIGDYKERVLLNCSQTKGGEVATTPKALKHSSNAATN